MAAPSTTRAPLAGASAEEEGRGAPADAPRAAAPTEQAQAAAVGPCQGTAAAAPAAAGAAPAAAAAADDNATFAPRAAASPQGTSGSNSDHALSDSASDLSVPVAGDVEHGTGAAAVAEVQKAGGAKRPAWTRRPRLVAASVLLAGLAIGLSVLLYPRQPHWRLTKLDIDVARFSQMMMGQGNMSEPISFTADVAFQNPNYIGTTTEPGTFEVFYGSEVMAYGTTDRCSVGPRSSSSMHVDITAKMNEAMAQSIVAEVRSNNMKLKVHADVHTLAKVGPFKVKVHTSCDITASTMVLFSQPENVLTEKTCEFGYSL